MNIYDMRDGEMIVSQLTTELTAAVSSCGGRPLLAQSYDGGNGRRMMSDQVVSMDKQYRTRDGRKVRVLCVDADLGVNGDSVVGIIHGEDDPCTWRASGGYFEASDSRDDLIEVKPTVKVECWMNVYGHGIPPVHHRSRDQADTATKSAAVSRIACIHIEREVEHGEGL